MTVLCHCGTQEEAVEAAKALYLQLVAADCPVWALGVATALRTMSVECLVTEDLPRTGIRTICDETTRITKETIDFKALDEEGRNKHRKLHGRG